MNPVPVPEQLAVVEYPLAPLRVAAGAGTILAAKESLIAYGG